MDQLLQIEPLGTDAARAVCLRYVQSASGRSRLGTWLLPRELREDVCLVLAWQLLLAESAASGGLMPDVMTLRALLSEAHSPNQQRVLARALRPTIRAHGLAPECFQESLEGHVLLQQIGSFETRSLLLQQATLQTRGCALMLLSILGKRSERTVVLSTALGAALQMIVWLANMSECLARGFLPLSVEDIGRHRLSIMRLTQGHEDPGTAALVADQIAWIRELLEKGWPLCLELGWYHGRLLSFQLRLAAARLGSMETGGLRLFKQPKRGGWLGFLACLGASVLTRRAPPLARQVGG